MLKEFTFRGGPVALRRGAIEYRFEQGSLSLGVVAANHIDARARMKTDAGQTSKSATLNAHQMHLRNPA
jgi:hypothetical protein